jgi:hypothetical protein
MVATTHELAIEIGGMLILVRTSSAEFVHMLEDRYGKFVTGVASPRRLPPVGDHKDGLNGAGQGSSSRESRASNFQFPVSSFEIEVELVPRGIVTDEEDLRVRLEGGRWIMERGDFRAQFDPKLRRAWVRQTARPYAIDAVLRILHSLILAREGGFLVHAASAVRNGRAFLFAGVSGAGKTTISRLAPPDVKLLTDEISYVRPREQGRGNREQGRGNRGDETGNREQRTANSEQGIGKDGEQVQVNAQGRADHSLFPVPYSLFPAFEAFGTPFAGELARIGENLRAPVAALYLLAQGPENRVEPVSDAEAARGLLRNILFFAQDEELVRMIFETVCDFVRRVPVRRLVFTPDARVWELIT